MEESKQLSDRRRFISGVALGVAGLSASDLFGIPGRFAEELMLTPRQGEGPRYPDHLPLDTDNDLIVVNDQITPAVGEITHLSGRVLHKSGQPISNALVEIWQVDNRGIYLHSEDENLVSRDQNFQGFGRFLTGSSGEYYFRTIKPIAYSGRTAHIHFGVKMKGRETWNTQCFVKGEPQNETDRAIKRIKDPKARDSVILDFAPMKGSRIGELAARFDIVLGFTPVLT